MTFFRNAFRDRSAVIGLIAALVVFGGYAGPGRAPVATAQAARLDYDAQIARVPLFALLAKRHPELRRRFIDILRSASGDERNARVAYFRLVAALNTYLPPYFAITSSLAAYAYIDTYTNFLRHLHTVDPAMCRDFLHGRRLPPPTRANHSMLKILMQLTYQVVDHAVKTPSPAPSPKWVRNMAERLWLRVRGADEFAGRHAEVGCREVWTLFDIAKKELSTPDYTRFVGGYIYQISRNAGTRT